MTGPHLPCTVLPSDRPVVRLLGAPHLVGAGGTVDSARHDRCLAVLVFLAAREWHASTDQLASAFGGKERWSAAGVRSTMCRTKAWLGQTAAGQDRLRHVGRYQVDDVTSDWELFQTLVGSDITQTPTARLLQALSLVSGDPLEGAGSRHYGRWADQVRTDLRLSVAHVRWELTERLGSCADSVQS